MQLMREPWSKDSGKLSTRMWEVIPEFAFLNERREPKEEKWSPSGKL
jgi:hypothetical protein